MNTDRSLSLASIRRLPGARQSSCILLALGMLLMLAGAIYAAHLSLSHWLAGQDRYLAIHAASLVLPNAETAASSAAYSPSALPVISPEGSAAPGVDSFSEPSRPVRLHIPALDLSRSIINLPRIEDSQTGTWSHDVESLFRPGRKDLVGHWEGSAYPGQDGNMILVGHNYGQGFDAVFLRLGRLQVGQKVYVTDEAGRTFTYRVTTVQRLKWREKDSQELAAHWQYLDPQGPERLTMVTCAGAQFEPFPQRLYVVAEPVH